MKSILKQDSRDIDFHIHFGSVSEFPDTKDFDSGLTNDIEQPGETDCTAESATDVCTDQTKIVYDHTDLWALTPKTAQGADPRDSMNAVIKNGLLPASGGERDKRWVSYMRGDTGSMDYFDNVRSAMTLANSSITSATGWYDNWDLPSESVLPMPDYQLSGHDYKICGWTKINGEDAFRIKAWQGYFLYMPRSVFNKVMDGYGCGAYLPTTKEIQDKVRRGIIQRIVDALVNAVLALQRQFFLLKK